MSNTQRCNNKVEASAKREHQHNTCTLYNVYVPNHNLKHNRIGIYGELVLVLIVEF